MTPGRFWDSDPGGAGEKSEFSVDANGDAEATLGALPTLVVC